MISYTIDAALDSGEFASVLVSTDDAEIAQIAGDCGADLIYPRPAELASSTASTDSVCAHVLSSIGERFGHIDAFALLQPTSPLRTVNDIKQSIRIFERVGCKGIVISVTETGNAHPNYVYQQVGDGAIDERDKSGLGPLGLLMGEGQTTKPRQSFKQYYYRNGAVYVVDVAGFRRRGTILGDKTYGYMMPKTRSLNIDDWDDFAIAEAMMYQRSLGRPAGDPLE